VLLTPQINLWVDIKINRKTVSEILQNIKIQTILTHSFNCGENAKATNKHTNVLTISKNI